MIKIRINMYEMDIIKKMARKAEIGGKSHIRDQDDRQAELSMDQLVGQLSTFALHRYMFGDFRKWLDERWNINRNPTLGDGGHDVYALNVDVKGSLIRSNNKELNDYNLIIRPKEFHNNWVYILALVKLSPSKKEAIVYLMGWATSNLFPKHTEDSGLFKGAYVFPAKKLIPLPPFNWDWEYE